MPPPIAWGSILIALAVYLFNRKIGHIICVIRGRGIRGIIDLLSNNMEWLDWIQIILTLYITVGFLLGIFEVESFRVVSIFLMGVSWINSMIWIAFMWEDFAIFAGGVVYATKRIVSFIFALAFIVIAYAQMLYVVHKETDRCGGQDGGVILESPFCEFDSSLLR